MSDNIEIEVRIPVDARTWKKLRDYLNKNAKFVGKSKDIDKYYNLPEKSFLKTRHPVEYLRIRKGQTGNFVNYKYNYLDRTGKKTHADEFETHLEEPEQLERIFSALGYENFMTIDKTRESYRIKNFEIELDRVSELGTFVEIEAKGKASNKQETLIKLNEFARKLELDPDKEDNNGYVLLLMKRKGLIRV